MAIINLKEFYPWYTHDEYIEVSDEVAAELRADKLYEAAHQRRIVRNKAQYSLDCNDGIEYSACLHEPTPQELLERMDQFCTLWNALNTLPEIQGRRVDACVILGKSYCEVAKSTFWNTIARVLGNYSGKLSAEALTMNCKRNVKPEMAELKGKRLSIASELEEGTRLNTGMVKQLCSVDPIEAEKKFKDPFHFDPSHTTAVLLTDEDFEDEEE